jgi:uncharacterized protein
MRMSSRRLAEAALALALIAVPALMPAAWLTPPAAALDAVARTPVPPPGASYRSAREAVRVGMRDYNAGDKEGAARALEYAATQGHSLALWKLGRMYADGDGVPHDDLKAFEFFSKIADESRDDGLDSPNAGVIASAYVSLGGYFLDGIKGSYVRAEPERALEMFQYAASYFGDPAAQYHLARLYLDGVGTDQDPRQAARWFNLAAEKGHRPAQALLGQLLVTGNGVPMQRPRGLMWLSLANEAADPQKEAWIGRLYAQASAQASAGDRADAQALADQYARKRR